jgi:ABC-type branched-subunit amino acid transport system permease subunit
MRALGGALGVSLLVFAPFIVDDTRLSTATAAVAQVALYLSLIVLVRISGQVSLCQLALQGVGAAMFGHAMSHGGLGAFNLGLPWALAVVLAGLLTVPVGLIVAIPAIRLAGTFLALATLGFGILLQQAGFGFSLFFGAGGSIATPRPRGAEGPWAFYYAVLAAVALCAVMVKMIERARLGRLLRAVGDSPLALATLGTNVAMARTLAFAFSAFLAGVSGALAGGVGERTNASSFQALASLGLIAVLAISGAVGGGGTIAPAFVAGMAFTFLPSYATESNVDAANAFQLGFGALAILVALLSNGRWSEIFARSAARSRHRAEVSPVRERITEPVLRGQPS